MNDRFLPSSASVGQPAAETARPARPLIPTNPPLVRRILTAFIANEVRKVGVERVVVGLSGGVDSALSAFLAAAALGPENVLALKMPYNTSSRESLEQQQPERR